MYRAPVDCDDVDIPVAADLARLLEGAVTVRLREGGVVDGRSLGGRLLAEVSGDGLDELCGLLRLAEGGRPFHCMCHGDLAVEVEGPGGAVAIGVHHGLSLRLPGFSSDVELADGRALLAWLASRGEPGPLEAFDAAVEAGRAAQGHRRRWVEATPPVLVPRLRELEGDGMGLPRRSGDPAHVEALELLRSAYSDEAATNAGAAYVFDVGEDFCAEDFNADGLIDITDLLTILDKWGPCSGCPQDLDADGVVGIDDMLMVLGVWGSCE